MQQKKKNHLTEFEKSINRQLLYQYPRYDRYDTTSTSRQIIVGFNECKFTKFENKKIKL